MVPHRSQEFIFLPVRGAQSKKFVDRWIGAQNRRNLSIAAPRSIVFPNWVHCDESDRFSTFAMPQNHPKHNANLVLKHILTEWPQRPRGKLQGIAPRVLLSCLSTNNSSYPPGEHRICLFFGRQMTGVSS